MAGGVMVGGVMVGGVMVGGVMAGGVMAGPAVSASRPSIGAPAPFGPSGIDGIDVLAVAACSAMELTLLIEAAMLGFGGPKEALLVPGRLSMTDFRGIDGFAIAPFGIISVGLFPMGVRLGLGPGGLNDTGDGAPIGLLIGMPGRFNRPTPGIFAALATAIALAFWIASCAGFCTWHVAKAMAFAFAMASATTGSIGTLALAALAATRPFKRSSVNSLSLAFSC
jgi:hypothetical protein